MKITHLDIMLRQRPPKHYPPYLQWYIRLQRDLFQNRMRQRRGGVTLIRIDLDNDAFVKLRSVIVLVFALVVRM